MNNVVVTGASGGIGFASVQMLLDRGVNVLATARTEEQCRALAQRFTNCNVKVVQLDIGRKNGIADAALDITRLLDGATLHGLVNNAGTVLAGPLADVKVDQIRDQFEVNLFGPIELTQALLPLMRLRDQDPQCSRRIVMVSSAAARFGTPFLGAYCASKAALEITADVLRRELAAMRVDVVIVAPGIIATPIWEKASGIDLAQFSQSDHAGRLARVQRQFVKAGRRGADPSIVASAICEALLSPYPKLRYAPADGGLSSLSRWLMPRKIIDRAVAKWLRQLG